MSTDDDYVLSDSEEYRPTKRRRTTNGLQRTTPKTKKAAASHAESTSDIDAASTHGVSRHSIKYPERLEEALLQWYGTVHAARGMPWRKPYNASWTPEEKAQRAYEVWISEIMLQQTQVATVIPYYNRWMSKFPTIKELASSDTETVNGLWKGLGYYSRAARLLAGAQKVVSELGGFLPDNAKDMEANVPGIGRYSAGAICSISYNERVPVLDGNVHRLLSRVLALHALPKAKTTLDILWAAATSLVEVSERPGDLNQALIELGSTVCKVRDPNCQECPIREECVAYQQETQSQVSSFDYVAGNLIPDIEELCKLCEPLPSPSGTPVTAYPMKAQRKKAREETDIVNVIEWRPYSTHSIPVDRHFLLVRRPDGGLLGGLHEFPTMPDVNPKIAGDELLKVPHTLLCDLLAVSPPPFTNPSQEHGTAVVAAEDGVANGGVQITSVRTVGDVIHVFSHIRKTYRVQWVILEGGQTPPALKSTSIIDRTIKPRKGNKTAAKGSVVNTAAPISRWTTLEQVSDANVGTGVMKVWNLTRKLWEKA
ncbi:DNA glycosylase [Punctularia strigosozonata HHB-11173 SS5]|uniref:DNA glycosylase n=1 Tax=Punctularia strigosozonata (strain HHB-11173) TaxID=741275 RepID=UPI0004416CFB|nr:DNA glycosylase [Punctularia strigosozonata HHB-11173 SS5]EIN08854.1 DNA glycosylase [Punctularia strigosozonata HHB-11173 SS5]